MESRERAASGRSEFTGCGGTNAFIILEEPPEVKPSGNYDKSNYLLTLSAKGRKSLDGYMGKLADYLRAHPDVNLADLSYTLFEGRDSMQQRRVLAVRDREEAIKYLENADQRRVYTHSADDTDKSVVFMFPGGGAQYADMGLGLYTTEAVFKQHMDAALKS